MVKGTLFVVATPLGNADDASPRARQVLAQAGVVLAEDTRRAGLLLRRMGVERAAQGRLLSFYEHNEQGRIPQVLQALEQGQDVALVSDAGTPLVSDPGFRLVAACRQAGFAVSPVPGPSAPLAALSACGLPPQPFVFLGFLPRRAAEQRRVWEQFGSLPATLVFFERKDRVAATLALAAQVLGNRQACLARELTKAHEEFILGDLPELAGLERELLGEVTVVVGPPRQPAQAAAEAEVLALAGELAEQGLKPREIARRVAAQVQGWSAKDVYDRLAAQNREDDHGR